MELAFMDWIQNILKSPVMDTFMIYFTTLGDKGILYYIILVLLLINKKTRKIGIVMGIAMIFNFLISNLALKPLIARPRPFHINTAVEILIHKPSSYSFPSGHSAQAFAVAGAFLFMNYHYAKPMLIFASLMAFSRVYLYVHYPSDVLAGAVIGLLCGYLAYRIFHLILQKKEA